MSPPAVLIAVLGLLAAQAAAQDLTRLYPRDQLEADQTRWREQITAEFRETIAPAIRPEDKPALAGVRLEFPLAGESGDPFAFYTDPAGKVIHLPALSLRFFSDLLVATAWLDIHGYDATTVQDYVGVLFRDAERFPRAPLPGPLDTLGVPANARDEAAVSERASRSFGQTLVFLIAHELGHIARGHGTGRIADAQVKQEEIEADAFAIDLVQRIPVVPLGLESWFLFDLARHKAREELASPEGWAQYQSSFRHPLSSARLSALADALEKNASDFARLEPKRDVWTERYRTLFSQYFRMSVPFEDQPIAHWAKRSRLLELRRAGLEPRRPAVTLPAIVGGGTDQPLFNGLFRATTKGTGSAAPFDMLLIRIGDDLHGAYTNTAGQGSINGTVSADRAAFTWEQGAARGSGQWQSTPDGTSLRGTWGKGDDTDSLGEWNAVRAERASP